MSRSVRAARVSLLALVQLLVLGLVLSALVVTPVTAAEGPDLTVEKSVNDADLRVDFGQSIVYTVVARNVGTAAATGVRVDDGSIDVGQSTVTGASWTSGGSPAAACTTDASNNVRCDIGTLAAGASATVTINVTIASDAAAACPPAPTGGTDDSIRNTATARASDEPVENQSHPPENRSNAVDVTINCPAPPAANVDLVDVVKSAFGTTAGRVNLGQSYTYTISARNAGTDAAANVVISDGSIDTGQSSVTGASWRIGTGAATACAVNTATNGVTCTIGTLAGGATATVTINVTIASTSAAACPTTDLGTDDDIRNTASAKATNEPAANQSHPPENRSNAVLVEINCAGGGTGPTVTRVAGADRYATAAEVSRQIIAPQPGGTVYIAYGLNFPDALAGAPAARKDNAPLLLVATGSVPGATCAEIGRLDPTRIVVLGSEAVVSAATANAARTCSQAATVQILRRAGPDRYATAAAVANASFPTAKTIMLAYGLNFPDALSGSGAAATFGMPILLTGTNSLPTATCAQIGVSDPTKIYVLGSSAVVSDAVVAAAQSCSGATSTFERLSGADRYATSAAINAKFFNAQNADDAMVATGLNFPDALGAGADGAPVYLTTTNSLPPVISQAISTLDPARIAVIGGPTVVSDNVMTQLRAT